MKTEKHPYSKVIHFTIGGSIPGVELQEKGHKIEFFTLCHRVFKQGDREIMQSGALGAENTTCKKCIKKLKSS